MDPDDFGAARFERHSFRSQLPTVVLLYEMSLPRSKLGNVLPTKSSRGPIKDSCRIANSLSKELAKPLEGTFSPGGLYVHNTAAIA